MRAGTASRCAAALAALECAGGPPSRARGFLGYLLARMKRLARTLKFLAVLAPGPWSHGGALGGEFAYDDGAALRDNPLLGDLGHDPRSARGRAAAPNGCVGNPSFGLDYRAAGMDVRALRTLTRRRDRLRSQLCAAQHLAGGLGSPPDAGAGQSELGVNVGLVGPRRHREQP